MSQSSFYSEETGIDWSACELIEVVEGKVSGTPVLKGTRIPADVILANFETGSSVEEIAENYPTAGMDRIIRLLRFVRQQDLLDAA